MDYPVAIKKKRTIATSNSLDEFWVNYANHKRYPKLALTPVPAEPWCPRVQNWKPSAAQTPKVVTIKAASLHKAIAFLQGPEADADTLSPKLFLGGQGQRH